MTADYAGPPLAPESLVQAADDESRRRGAYRVEVADIDTWEPAKMLSTAAAMLRSRWLRPAARQMHPGDAAVGLALADALTSAACGAAAAVMLMDGATTAELYRHDVAVARAVLTGHYQAVGR